MLHIGNISDQTVATMGLFPGYLEREHRVSDDTTVYQLKYSDGQKANKRMKLSFDVFEGRG